MRSDNGRAGLFATGYGAGGDAKGGGNGDGGYVTLGDGYGNGLGDGNGDGYGFSGYPLRTVALFNPAFGSFTAEVIYANVFGARL